LTEFARSRLEAGGIPAERIAIVPNFASDPGPRTRSASDSDEVLFVGRLSNEKGIRVLLDAWSQLADPHLRLTVVGSGPLLEEVKAKASGSIKVVGWLEPADVLQHMLSARALVVPSLWYEVQPLVVLEALACGLPVLYSNLGALGEIVGDGGSPFSAGSPSHLVTRLSEMLDGAEVKRMSDGGRGQFLSRFDTQRALASRIALYQEVVRA
jgi:glycosyltransferase involved in cell wall biosynthesis